MHEPHTMARRRSLWRCFICFIMLALVHMTLSFYGVYEFFMQSPLIDFVYPLHMDMQNLDDQLSRGDDVNTTPLNDFGVITVPGSSDRCILRDASKELLVLVLVKSHIKNVKRRDIIRETWGAEKDYKLNRVAQRTVKWRTMFLVTRTSDDTLHNSHIDGALVTEQNGHSDLLIGNFPEQFPNQTLKTIFGFKWVATHCAQAHYIVFADDECFVHTFNVIKYVEHIVMSVDKFYMRMFLSGNVWRYESPVRSKSDRRYVSVKEYPYNRYPPYLDDKFYIVAGETLKRLYRIMPYVKLATPIEVFIGIVAYKLEFKISNNDYVYIEKVPYSQEKFRFLLSSSGYHDDLELNRVWTYINAM